MWDMGELEKGKVWYTSADGKHIQMVQKQAGVDRSEVDPNGPRVVIFGPTQESLQAAREQLSAARRLLLAAPAERTAPLGTEGAAMPPPLEPPPPLGVASLAARVLRTFHHSMSTVVLDQALVVFPMLLLGGWQLSAELSAVGGVLGRLPSPDEYLEYAKQLDSMSSEIYRYMNFDQIESFHNAAQEGKLIAAEQIVEVS